MSAHKYKVGQRVRLSTRPNERAAPSSFVVTKLLPKDWVNYQYRIKESSTGQERVVSEPELL